MIPNTNSPPSPDTNEASRSLPPNMIWTARADRIDAEDGTIVAMLPRTLFPAAPIPLSEAAWPGRRALIAAAPELLGALETVRDLDSLWHGVADDPDKRAAYLAVVDAIAIAKARP